MTFQTRFCILQLKHGQCAERSFTSRRKSGRSLPVALVNYNLLTLKHHTSAQVFPNFPCVDVRGFRMSSFYKCARWERKRAKILRRDGYLCQISKRYGKTVPADTVHHIFPRDEFPEYQLVDWNLISLSASIHDTMHDRTSGKLSPAGAELLRRICRKYGKEIPDQYKE